MCIVSGVCCRIALSIVPFYLLQFLMRTMPHGMQVNTTVCIWIFIAGIICSVVKRYIKGVDSLMGFVMQCQLWLLFFNGAVSMLGPFIRGCSFSLAAKGTLIDYICPVTPCHISVADKVCASTVCIVFALAPQLSPSIGHTQRSWSSRLQRRVRNGLGWGSPPIKCIACECVEPIAPKFKRCKGCTVPTAYYCSNGCQRADWRRHKAECRNSDSKTNVGGHGPLPKTCGILEEAVIICLFAVFLYW